MANFDEAVAFVLENEGGYSDNANDAGGKTNFGISSLLLYALKGKYGNDVSKITLAQAKDIYYKEFWLKAPFTSLWNQRIANYVFDCCIMHGIDTGITILQRAVWAVLGYRYIEDDGFMGAKTLAAVQQAGFLLTYSLAAERANYCRTLALTNHKNTEFLNGWLKRCYRI